MPCALSRENWREIHWLLQRATQLNGLPIILPQQPKELDAEIFVDAPDTGWGVASRHTETAGYWKEEEKDLLINVRELKTIAFVPQHHEREFEGVLIKIFSNNITALKYAKKSREETASLWLQELALEVQEIVVKHNLQPPEKTTIRIETTTQVLQYGTRNVESPKARCLRNEREYTSTSALESEPRPTSRSDQCMEPTVDENSLIFASILETDTKNTMETEGRQRYGSCIEHADLTKSALVAGGSEREFNLTNELQALQTMVLNHMTVIRWYQTNQKTQQVKLWIIYNSQINSTHSKITICNGDGRIRGIYQSHQRQTHWNMI
ncbi:hypothetical protein G6F36_012061 [Rhizopus arrhizus]|nr:hypothetical protein G6F36_012061 [Rhizopus arrhizus]